MRSGDGNDQILASAFANAPSPRLDVFGEAGDDYIQGTSNGANFLAGGSGNDGLFGGFGAADTIYGGIGRIMVAGGAGKDVVTAGIDRIDLSGINLTFSGTAGGLRYISSFFGERCERQRGK